MNSEFSSPSRDVETFLHGIARWGERNHRSEWSVAPPGLGLPLSTRAQG